MWNLIEVVWGFNFKTQCEFIICVDLIGVVRGFKLEIQCVKPIAIIKLGFALFHVV